MTLLSAGPRLLLCAVAAMLVASCGSEGREDPTATGQAKSLSRPVERMSAAEAGRFLTQATFGPTDASIRELRDSTFAAWIDAERAAPVSGSHLAHVDARLPELRAVSPNANLSANQFYESFWLQAATGPDQLRQRVKFALSQIFVVSLADPVVSVRGAASYYDMLGANAFGNYRTLLEQVTLHPTMGLYLTHLGNRKADPATGRLPDENYAREVLQLMSVGVHLLHPDGSVKTDAAGAPIPSYTPADVSNLAAVLTGFSYYSPAPTASTFAGGARHADAATRSMIPYPAYHATTAKTFLGTTIPASATADPAGDLRIALDAIFNHPNVGPFVGRQLIQRLVTSNPSRAYVWRVSSVFDNNGRGVRGDMGAVVRAVLLDPEARDGGGVGSPTAGKLREPVVRLANWIRAFDARSQSGDWLLTSTASNTSLSQAPLTAPSVFNFWRPGYSPPNTRIGGQNLVAPEFQVVEEVSVAGYVNTLQTAIDRGLGGTAPGATGPDVRAVYTTEIALARDPAALVERVNGLLLYGQMSPVLRGRIVDAVGSVRLPAATATPAQVDTALANRVKTAILLTMASPEYLAQR